MNFDLITTAVKKAFDTFVENIIAYIIGILIVFVGSIFIVTIAPLLYGLYYMVIKGTRGEKVEIKDVFYGFSSLSVIIRAWIGLIGFIIVPAIVGFIIGFIIGILTHISSVFAILSILIPIVSIIMALFLYFTLYIYVMTPSENIIYAIKESISIGKANVIMVLLTMIIASICSIFMITYPLGMLFAAYMLKELKPDIKDASGI